MVLGVSKYRLYEFHCVVLQYFNLRHLLFMNFAETPKMFALPDFIYVQFGRLYTISVFTRFSPSPYLFLNGEGQGWSGVGLYKMHCDLASPGDAQDAFAPGFMLLQFGRLYTLRC